MKTLHLILILIATSRFLPADSASDLHDQLVSRRPDGLLVVHPSEVPEKMNNPWDAETREAHIRQINRYLKTADKLSISGSTYFENEKQWYGNAMFKFLATGTPRALNVLQDRDHQHEQWHRETAGIDYYACFTIKHQVRKYFQFGPGLDPAYREQMFRGAKSWTEKDPLRRDHYAFNPDKRNQGWGPDARNSWVDVRTTDNLAWMRNVAVYLMAEETENTEVAEIYKQRMRKFVGGALPGGHRRMGQPQLPLPHRRPHPQPLRFRQRSGGAPAGQSGAGSLLHRRRRQIPQRQLERPHQAGLQRHRAHAGLAGNLQHSIRRQSRTGRGRLRQHPHRRIRLSPPHGRARPGAERGPGGHRTVHQPRPLFRAPPRKIRPAPPVP